MIVRELGLVVAQVGADGAVPVDLGGARPARARGAVQAAADRLAQRAREPALEVLDHLAHDLPRRLAGLRRQDVG